MAEDMLQIVEGSERWYCRVEGCGEFTAGNVPFGRCGMHALEHLGGAEQPDKGFPPVGGFSPIGTDPKPRQRSTAALPGVKSRDFVQALPGGNVEHELKTLFVDTFTELARNQHALDPAAAKVLYDNLWTLYDDTEPAALPGVEEAQPLDLELIRGRIGIVFKVAPNDWMAECGDEAMNLIEHDVPALIAEVERLRAAFIGHVVQCPQCEESWRAALASPSAPQPATEQHPPIRELRPVKIQCARCRGTRMGTFHPLTMEDRDANREVPQGATLYSYPCLDCGSFLWFDPNNWPVELDLRAEVERLKLVNAELQKSIDGCAQRVAELSRRFAAPSQRVEARKESGEVVWLGTCSSCQARFRIVHPSMNDFTPEWSLSCTFCAVDVIMSSLSAVPPVERVEPVRMWVLEAPFNKLGVPVMGQFGSRSGNVVIFTVSEWQRLCASVPQLQTTQFEVGSYE